jgi:hypothetical protein
MLVLHAREVTEKTEIANCIILNKKEGNVKWPRRKAY